MADSSSTITAVLKAKDETKPGFDSAGSNMGKLGSAAKAVGGILAGAFAVAKIYDFGKASVEAFVDAERATRQLEHAVIDISKGTREQVNAISDLSDALQKKAGIDGDALKAGAAQLSTFGLSSKAVVNLTKSLADLTVNQNGVNASADNYIGSANTIAKALNGQFGILEKSGIRFTAAQQALIQYGSETEKVAALQEGLNQNLRETTDTVGNSAEGAMARLSAAFGEIQEAVGGIIVPLLASLAEAFVPIAQGVQSFIDSLKGIGEAGSSLNEFLLQLDAQTGIVTFFKEQWEILVSVWNDQLKPAFADLWEALQPFMPFLQALAQVVGVILVVAIAGIVKAIVGWVQIFALLFEAFAAFEKWWSKTLQPIFSGIADGIATAVSWVEKLISALNKLNIVQGAKSIGSSIVKAITGKATGGPVDSGTPYMVGEEGPELFVPNNSGRIIPNNRSGGGGITLVLQGNTFMGKEGIARMIGKELVNELKISTRIVI